MPIRRAAVVVLSCVVFGAWEGFAFAAAPADRECESTDFTDSSAPALQLASVKPEAGKRVHFFRGGGTCPDGPASQCRRKAYLTPDDTVVMAKQHAGFTCAWYEPGSGGAATVGWLPSAALSESKPVATPPLAAWVREWSRGAALGNDATIKISLDPDGQSLRVSGEAQWMSDGMEAPHTGEVEGVARPQGNRLAIQGGGDCVLELHLLGEGVLFARDGHRCGGMNVTFDGLY